MIDDEALRKVLKQKIKSIKEYPKSVQKKVEMEMAKRYNVKFGDVVDIFNDISPNSVEELSYDMLFKLMKCIKEIALNSDQRIDSSELNEVKYFTPQEIVQFDVPYPDEEKDFDLVITDWIQRSPTLYKIFTNIDEVTNVWRNYNKLRFNPETQRDLVPVIVNGKKVNRLDIKRESVNEMKKLMKKGMYFNVTGTININPDLFPDHLPYKDGKNLIIPKEAHMDLIEGFHNYIAETETKDENPDWEFDIEFDLRIMNVEECNRFIIQMNKKNHFRPAQVVRIDTLSEINYIIDSLNKRTSFHLYSTIDKDRKVFLNKLLTNIYGNITEREVSLEVLEVLESGLNTVIEKFKLFNKSLSRKQWFIYVLLVKYAKDTNKNIIDLIQAIDVDVLSEKFKSLKEPTPINIKIFNKYMKEVAGNDL